MSCDGVARVKIDTPRHQAKTYAVYAVHAKCRTGNPVKVLTIEPLGHRHHNAQWQLASNWRNISGADRNHLHLSDTSLVGNTQESAI